jgi:hypothetical protein
MAHVVNRFNARDAEALALRLLDAVSFASAKTCVACNWKAIRVAATTKEKNRERQRWVFSCDITGTY